MGVLACKFREAPRPAKHIISKRTAFYFNSYMGQAGRTVSKSHKMPVHPQAANSQAARRLQYPRIHCIAVRRIHRNPAMLCFSLFTAVIAAPRNACPIPQSIGRLLFKHIDNIYLEIRVIHIMDNNRNRYIAFFISPDPLSQLSKPYTVLPGSRKTGSLNLLPQDLPGILEFGKADIILHAISARNKSGELPFGVPDIKETHFAGSF